MKHDVAESRCITKVVISFRNSAGWNIADFAFVNRFQILGVGSVRSFLRKLGALKALSWVSQRLVTSKYPTVLSKQSINGCHDQCIIL